jgi:hypothetical protein
LEIAPPPFYYRLKRQAKETGTNHILMMGDLNCDQSKNNNKLEQILGNSHMTQLIQEPTHITESSETILDIIATSSLDLVKEISVRAPTLSNHSGVTVTLDLKRKNERGAKRAILNYSKANWRELNEELASFDWEQIMQEPDLECMVSRWTKEYIKIVEKHIEKKHIRVDDSNKVWKTEKISRLIRKKRKAYHKLKVSNTPRNLSRFKKLKNKLQRAILREKRKQDENLNEKIHNSVGNNDKLWWKLVKQFYKKTKNSSAEQPPLLVNGKETTSDREKANAFNKYFASIASMNNTQPPLLEEAPEHEDPLNGIRITKSMVKRILQNLNPSKASGPYTISTIMLKETAESISGILARLYNYSLATSKFPSSWKVANVTPIHKKDDKFLASNYRPVSLLNISAKVFERCVHDAVFSYFQEKNILSKVQGAYMPSNSTTCQLIDLYHQINEGMDKGLECRLVFCDFSKAFDKIWHRGAVHKLKKAGIGGTLLKWFED